MNIGILKILSDKTFANKKSFNFLSTVGNKINEDDESYK